MRARAGQHFLLLEGSQCFAKRGSEGAQPWFIIFPLVQSGREYRLAHLF